MSALLISLCFQLQTVHAQCMPPLQAPDAAQLQAAQDQAKDRGFLWRLHKGDHTSYLYGTLHVAKLEWVFPGPQISLALRATDRLALELNLLDPATAKALQAGAREPAPQKIPAAFGSWVKERAEALCLNPDDLQGLNPGFQAVTITLAEARAQGLEAAYGIDLILAMSAQSSGRPIDALELVQTQLDVLTVGGQEEDVDAAEELDPVALERQKDVLVQSAQAWATGDYATMNDYANWCHCMDREADRVRMKRALEGRNPHLADGIDALHMQGHKVFAAVGSLHTIGTEGGLPALLVQRGYTVERVF